MNKHLRFIIVSLLALMVGGAATAQEAETIFKWTYDGQTTAMGDIEADGGTVTLATTDDSKTWSTESAAYNSNVAADMKGGAKGLKAGANALYIKITLDSGSFREGDVISVCGYNGWSVSTSSGFGGEIDGSLDTGTGKGDYNVGSVEIPADIETNTIYLRRAQGSSTAIAVVSVTRVTSATAPKLSVSPTELTLSATAATPTVAETFTVSGANLTPGERVALTCSDANLQLNPSVVAVGADGSVSQEVTVTFAATANVELTTAEITASWGELSKTVEVNYSALVEAYAQQDVTDDTTWDFSKLTGTVEITDNTEKNTEFLYANRTDITFPEDVDFGSKSLTFMGQYPIRNSQYAQNVVLKFNTTVAGKVTVTFSNTGSSNRDRVVMVNDQVGTVEAEGTTQRTEEFEVEAGVVTIKGVTLSDESHPNNALRFFKVVFEKSESNLQTLTASYDPATIALTQGETLVQPVLSILDESGAEVTGLNIAYSSDNEAVATVDASTGEIGLGTAIGTAIITASIEGGEIYADATATLTITVEAKQINAVTDKFWKFDEWASGEFASTTVVDDLECLLDGSKSKMSTSNATIDGEPFATRFQFGGKSNINNKADRVLHFKVDGNCKITVYIGSNGAGRFVHLVQGSLSEDNCVAEAESDAKKSFIYENTSGASDFYLYCTGNAVDVYGIKVWHGESIQVSDAGYATLYYGEESLKIPSGVTASIVTAVGGGSMTMEDLSDVIPAATGVVLKAAAGTYCFETTASTMGAPAGNLLKGSDVEALTEGGDKFYMLSLNAQNEAGSAGFYWGAANGGAFTNRPHKAYLALTTATAAKSFYLFEETATGVEKVEMPVNRVQGSGVYNLNGQRVDNSKLRAGIFIVNGKKVVVK